MLDHRLTPQITLKLVVKYVLAEYNVQFIQKRSLPKIIEGSKIGTIQASRQTSTTRSYQPIYILDFEDTLNEHRKPEEEKSAKTDGLSENQEMLSIRLQNRLKRPTETSQSLRSYNTGCKKISSIPHRGVLLFCICCRIYLHSFLYDTIVVCLSFRTVIIETKLWLVYCNMLYYGWLRIALPKYVTTIVFSWRYRQ